MTDKPAGVGPVEHTVRPWEQCSEHGQAESRVWACPKCLVELRERVRMLEATEEGAQIAFAHVVEQKQEIERENKKLRRLLDAAYADIRRQSRA